MAKKMKNADLLKDKRVVKEIEKHKWLESEKAHKDIGFDSAAKDWLDNYSDAWKNHNMRSW
ncbi:MAG TPA: DUF4032 domain-containing protein [Candidatus Omnitrophota bacterium]|nr:DUF4032 domain-containing protein [Candidatus Omnitrophota bacterium]